MPRQKLTDKIVQNVKPPKTGRTELPDALEHGLALRVTSDDRRSWAVRVWAGPPDKRVQRRVTLGHPRERDGSPVLTLAEARQAARDIKVAAAEGRPLTIRDGLKGAATFAETVEKYLVWAKANQRPRTYGETARILRHADLESWKSRPAKSITAADARELRDRITARAPIMATRVLRKVSGCGTWAVNEGIITTSPSAGVVRTTREVPRDRVLNRAEIAAYIRVAETLSYPGGAICQLLAYTAQRLREVSEMEWAEVDLDAKMWVLPKRRAKNNRENHIHLSPPALAILREIAAERDKIEVRKRSALVFTHIGTPISGYDDLKERLDAAMAKELGHPVAHFVFHDVRRTAASVMGEELDVPPHIIERILNHKKGEISPIAAIYNKARYAAKVRDALDQLASYISQATTPNVIPLHVKTLTDAA